MDDKKLNGHLDVSVKMLQSVLRDNNYPEDVKIITIQALGDICLMSEDNFVPYYAETMMLLVGAGHMSLQPIDQSLPREDQIQFHQLRSSIVDSFLSIINGIKSPDGSLVKQLTDIPLESIASMFHYLEALMQATDLEKTAELAVQIIDLYCDLVIMQTNDHRHREKFIQTFRESKIHDNIQAQFCHLKSEMEQTDDGLSIKRF